MENENAIYEKEGVFSQVQGMTTLFVSLGIIGIVIIFLGSFGGQVYNQSAPQIAAISDANIKANVNAAIASGFQAQATAAGYLPLFVGALIFIVVLGLFVGLQQSNAGGYGGGGGAL